MAQTRVAVAERGQVTIPKRLRDRYGIRAGQQFTVIDLGGAFVLSPHESRIDPLLDQIRDELVKEGATLEEMLAEIRARREASGPTSSPPVLG